MPSHPIVDVLNQRFSGRISSGAHGAESGAACILEVVAAAHGLEHTDYPHLVGMPDLRPLNDAYRADGARTLAMVRLGVVFWDWRDWSMTRRQAFASALALATVREVLPACLRACGLVAHAEACERVDTVGAAAAAAAAADAAAADAAAYYAALAAADAARAAYYAARAAYYAADAAAAAAADADAAADAAYAAADAADAAAHAAARAAARVAAAYAAAYAAYAHVADALLDRAVDIWVRCAQDSAAVGS